MRLFIIYIIFVAISYIVMMNVTKNTAQSFIDKYINDENIEEVKSRLIKSKRLPYRSTILLLSMVPIVNILVIISIIYYEDELTDELYKKIFIKEN